VLTLFVLPPADFRYIVVPPSWSLSDRGVGSPGACGAGFQLTHQTRILPSPTEPDKQLASAPFLAVNHESLTDDAESGRKRTSETVGGNQARLLDVHPKGFGRWSENLDSY
jgi:hypothetical protein